MYEIVVDMIRTSPVVLIFMYIQYKADIYEDQYDWQRSSHTNYNFIHELEFFTKTTSKVLSLIVNKINDNRKKEDTTWTQGSQLVKQIQNNYTRLQKSILNF